MATEIEARGGVKGMLHRIHNLKSRVASIKERSDEFMRHGIQTVEVVGGSMAWGWATGKWGPKEFFGVQADLLAGVALHGIGLFGMSPRYAEHAHNLGDASLASWGWQFGQAKAQAASATGFASAGQFQQTGFASASQYTQGTGFASASQYQNAPGR